MNRDQRYNQSKKGRARTKRYAQSEKGRATQRRAYLNRKRLKRRKAKSKGGKK